MTYRNHRCTWDETHDCQHCDAQAERIADARREPEDDYLSSDGRDADWSFPRGPFYPGKDD